MPLFPRTSQSSPRIPEELSVCDLEKRKSTSLIAPVRLSFNPPEDALEMLEGMDLVYDNMAALLAAVPEPKLGRKGYLAVDVGGTSMSLLDPELRKKVAAWSSRGKVTKKRPLTKLMRSHIAIMDMLEDLQDGGWRVVETPDISKVEANVHDCNYIAERERLRIYISAIPAGTGSRQFHISAWIQRIAGTTLFHDLFETPAELVAWLADKIPKAG